MGGLANFALRRAAQIAYGFIFANATGNAIDLLGTLFRHLADVGRAKELFGFQNIMLAARTAEACVEMALRWCDAGGTDVAVNTMGKGLATIDDHLTYIIEVRRALTKAGL